MKLLTALLLALLSLSACGPAVVPAGPVTRAAGIEGFEPPPLPWMPVPAWAFAPSPPPPAPSGPLPEAMLVMPDGARLPLRVWRPEGRPRFVILAIHGLADHGGNMLQEGGPLLAAGGALVYAYDQRGFGWTRARGYWAGAETMVNDARVALELIRARHPGVPIFLLGESMGGAVVLAMGRVAVDGIILSAPALWGRAHMPGFLRGLLWFAGHVLGPVAMPPSAPNVTASDNPAALLRFGRDPLTLRDIRFDMVSGLVDLMDQAVAALPNCCRDVPTLILLGGNDQVVPTPIARRVLRDASAPRVALYREGWHILLRDNVREQVARDIIEFLNMPDVPTPREADGAAWLAGAPR